MENIPEYLEIKDTVMTGTKDGRTIESIAIPEGVTKIAEYAFEECAALKRIVIPESVTEINDFAFKRCKNVKTVQYGGTLTQWCEMNNSFSLMRSAEHVLLGDGTDIKALTELVIPEDVTKIGDDAFRGCKNLTSVTIPNNTIKFLGGFRECENIKTVKFSGTLAQWCEMAPDFDLMKNAESVLLADGTDIKALTELVIPEGVTEISEWAFSHCSALTSVTIPKSVTKINNWAFNECKNIKIVRYGGTLAQWCEMGSNINLMASAESVLLADGTDIKKLTELVIPEGVTKIGENAFVCCAALERVVLPESVMKILFSAFNLCVNLKTVRYGGTLAQWCDLDIDSFYVGKAEHIILGDGTDIKALTELVIPEGVTKIGAGAFEECAALESVTISQSVTEIGEWAFNRCTSLKSIAIPPGVEASDMFFDEPKNLELIRYGGTLAQWCAADIDRWLLEYPKQILLADGTDIKSLTELVIPEGVTRIGNNAFSHCSALESVTIPASVTEIGTGAFDGCISLTSVIIPEGVTKISEWAFQYCAALTSVTIPKSVTEIKCEAFCGCNALTDVTVPENVTLIGFRAFSECAALESLTIPASVTQIGGLWYPPESMTEAENNESDRGLSELERTFKDLEESGYLSFIMCPKLKDVRYGGTKEEWHKLMKHESFKSGVMTVHCSDGDIT